MLQECFLAQGCTWDFQADACVPDNGGGESGGGQCGFVPPEFCEQVPGCVLEGEECVPA